MHINPHLLSEGWVIYHNQCEPDGKVQFFSEHLETTIGITFKSEITAFGKFDMILCWMDLVIFNHSTEAGNLLKPDGCKKFVFRPTCTQGLFPHNDVQHRQIENHSGVCHWKGAYVRLEKAQCSMSSDDQNWNTQYRPNLNKCKTFLSNSGQFKMRYIRLIPHVMPGLSSILNSQLQQKLRYRPYKFSRLALYNHSMKSFF